MMRWPESHSNAAKSCYWARYSLSKSTPFSAISGPSREGCELNYTMDSSSDGMVAGMSKNDDVNSEEGGFIGLEERERLEEREKKSVQKCFC